RVLCEGLIQSNIWEECLKAKSTSINHNFRSIIQKYPNLAKDILDKCQIKAINEDETKSTYNFNYIDDNVPKFKINEGSRTMGGFFKSIIYGWSDINSSWRGIHPVTLMRKKPDLLHHPVITQWMHYKWKDYGLVIHYSYICFDFVAAFSIISIFYQIL
ncbi:unnamed protein product, partial [Meganyctiphanes norvegica]